MGIDLAKVRQAAVAAAEAERALVTAHQTGDDLALDAALPLLFKALRCTVEAMRDDPSIGPWKEAIEELSKAGG